jgi:hypothetical protein
MVLGVSGLRLSLSTFSFGSEAEEEVVAQPFDIYNLLASQNGDLLLTQDEKPIRLNSQRFLLTQREVFLTTEQDDFLLIN